MSDRPKERSTGVNRFMLIFILILFGGVALYMVFGPQGDHATPEDVNHAVKNNLRLLSTTAIQYFTDHGGASVRSADLIGTSPSQSIKAFQTVANETYTQTILQGHPITASSPSGARTVTFGP